MYKNSICFYFSLETEPYNAHKLLLILLTGEGLVKGFFQWMIMWDRGDMYNYQGKLTRIGSHKKYIWRQNAFP